jgi:hypothetical protein
VSTRLAEHVEATERVLDVVGATGWAEIVRASFAPEVTRFVGAPGGVKGCSRLVRKCGRGGDRSRGLDVAADLSELAADPLGCVGAEW